MDKVVFSSQLFAEITDIFNFTVAILDAILDFTHVEIIRRKDNVHYSIYAQ